MYIIKGIYLEYTSEKFKDSTVRKHNSIGACTKDLKKHFNEEGIWIMRWLRW